MKRILKSFDSFWVDAMISLKNIKLNNNEKSWRDTNERNLEKLIHKLIKKLITMRDLD